MERKGKDKFQEAMARLDGIINDIEGSGAEMLGIISRAEGDGLSVTTVCRRDSDEYWMRIGLALGVTLADRGSMFRTRLLTSVVSAMCFAAAGDDDVRGVLKDVVIPRLKDAAEGQPQKSGADAGKKGGIVS